MLYLLKIEERDVQSFETSAFVSLQMVWRVSNEDERMIYPTTYLLPKVRALQISEIYTYFPDLVDFLTSTKWNFNFDSLFCIMKNVSNERHYLSTIHLNNVYL